MSILDKIASSAVSDDQAEFTCSDEVFGAQYPGIYEFLARIRHAGNSRKPGRLIIYYDQGKASLCLSDADTKQVAFHIDSGIYEALEAAESRLQSGSMDWRHSKRWQG